MRGDRDGAQGFRARLTGASRPDLGENPHRLRPIAKHGPTIRENLFEKSRPLEKDSTSRA